MTKPVLMLALGILGVVAGFLPGAPGPCFFARALDRDALQLILMVAAYAIPASLATIALMTRSSQQWQYMGALAGFALAFMKLRVWTQVTAFADLPVGDMGLIIAATGGVAVSLVGVLKNDAKA